MGQNVVRIKKSVRKNGPSLRIIQETSFDEKIVQANICIVKAHWCNFPMKGNRIGCIKSSTATNLYIFL